MKYISILHGVYPQQEMSLSETIEDAIKKAKEKLLSEHDDYHHVIICEIGTGDIEYLNELCEVTREDDGNDIKITAGEVTERLDCCVQKMCMDILNKER